VGPGAVRTHWHPRHPDYGPNRSPLAQVPR
jgi:hypothetical protein